MNKTRYIIRGIIDGSLSVMGVIIGAYNPDAAIILSAGIAGAFANGFSNMMAAFSAEEAIQYRYLKKLEESMLTDLKDTIKEDQIKKDIRRSAIYDGFSTIFGGLIPLIPFLFFIPRTSIILSITVTLILFIILGIYTAKISKLNIFYYSFKMVLFATLTGLVCYLVRYLVRNFI